MNTIHAEYLTSTVDEVESIITEVVQGVAPRPEVPEEGWSSVVLLGLLCAVENGEHDD